MRILVIGAGVIGSNLAADLFSSGRDVTILARGEWADALEKNGLLIDPIFSPRKKTYRIPVIRKLKTDDIYDVILVVMRYTQIESLISDLAANGSKNIVFVGNNLAPQDLVEKLSGKNVLFGFSMAAGHREKNKVVSISLHKITIGQLKGAPSNEQLIREIFVGTKVKATYQPNMEDYLLCHAAFVTPVAFACYYCDGDLKRIKNDKAYLNQIIDANIEGYSAIENAGHEILPDPDKDYRSRKYRRMCYFDGDTYIQHNTGIADGLSGLGAALGALAEQGIQMIYDTVHQVLAQGNYVLAVSEGTFGGAPTSYYDLWRVENGKVAEHWDVMETIADKETWQNQNGKF